MKFQTLIALNLMAFSGVLSMDCSDLDYSFGYIQDSSEADLASVGKSQGIDASTESQIDVTCTYVSYNGFQLYFQDDGVSSVYVYAYNGAATDESSENWSCSFTGDSSSGGNRMLYSLQQSEASSNTSSSAVGGFSTPTVAPTTNYQ